MLSTMILQPLYTMDCTLFTRKKIYENRWTIILFFVVSLYSDLGYLLDSKFPSLTTLCKTFYRLWKNKNRLCWMIKKKNDNFKWRLGVVCAKEKICIFSMLKIFYFCIHISQLMLMELTKGKTMCKISFFSSFIHTIKNPASLSVNY